MRATRPCRLALALALGLAGAGLPETAAASEALFKDRCAKCHARATSLARSLKGATPEAVTASLSAFLQSHHAPDEAERQSIAGYLAGLRK